MKVIDFICLCSEYVNIRLYNYDSILLDVYDGKSSIDEKYNDYKIEIIDQNGKFIDLFIKTE